MADPEVPGVPEGFGAPYRVMRFLGQGAMGVVVEARHELTNRRVAVKFLSPSLILDATARARLLREAEVARTLVHPAVVRAVDGGTCKEQPFVVYEYVGGGTVADEMARSGGKLAMERALQVTTAVGAALVAAHERGVIHRDVKPHNILLDDDGAPRLADFGLAAVADEVHRLTATGVILGTPHYMAPEQVDGGPVDGRTDLYALAASCVCMLTGRPPHDGKNLVTLLDAKRRPVGDLQRRAPTLPRPVVALLARALSPRPADRQPSVAVFLADLSRAASAGRLAASSPTVVTAAVPTEIPKSRHRAPTVAVASAVIVLLLVVLTLLPRPAAVSAVAVQTGTVDVRLAWHTSTAVATGAAFGPSNGGLVETFAPDGGVHSEHELILEGLTPATDYVVRLWCGDDTWTPPRTFTTRPFAIRDCTITAVSATTAVLSASASAPATMTVTVHGRSGGQALTVIRPPSRGPLWTVRLQGLPPDGPLKVTAHLACTETAVATAEAMCRTAALAPTVVAKQVIPTGDASDSAVPLLTNHAWLESVPVRAASRAWMGHLFVAAAGRGLHCLSCTDGSERWTEPVLASYEAIDWSGDRLYCVGVETEGGPRILRSVRCADGTSVWRAALLGRAIDPTLLLPDDAVVVGEPEGYLTCFDPADGRVRWRWTGEPLRPPFAAGSRARLWAATVRGDVVAIDVATGRATGVRLTGLSSPPWASPVETETTVVLGLEDGTLAAFDRTTGRPAGRLGLGGLVACLAVDVDTVIARADGPSPVLVAVDPTCSRRLWRWQPASRLKTLLLVDDGYVYCVDETDNIVCLDGRDGRVVWTWQDEMLISSFRLHRFDGSLLYMTSDYALRRLAD